MEEALVLTVEIKPVPIDTFLTRATEALASCTMYTSPLVSISRNEGLFIVAEDAALPSPVEPEAPVPAKVPSLPLTLLTIRTLSFPYSEKYTLPVISTLTPIGEFRSEDVAKLPSRVLPPVFAL